MDRSIGIGMTISVKTLVRLEVDFKTKEGLLVVFSHSHLPLINFNLSKGWLQKDLPFLI